MNTIKLGAAIWLGAVLVLGLNGPAAADAEIQVENDGLTLSAFAGSSGVVLSMNIRVIGPDGFIFEDRVEDSAIQWVPEGDLADGIYHWEAWTVTAERGASMREISLPHAVSPTDVQGQANHEIQAAAQAEPAEEIPVERLFAPDDKNVHIESGSFRVTDGWLEELDDGYLGSLDSSHNPNAAQRLIGRILDFLVPSAHAQNFTDDVVVTKANPSVVLDSSASVGQNWSMQGATSLWSFRDLQNANTVIGIVPGTANANALRITDTGNVGLGTAAATEALHIADSNPRIRLQNLSDAQTWYVKNTNQGRFEISENSGNDNPFSIEAGAPATALYVGSNGNIGLGTDDPQRDLHIMGNHIRVEDTNSTWDFNPGSQGLWFNLADPGPTIFGILKLQNDAPSNSIVAAGGGVGIGTASPSQKLHVNGNTFLDGSVGVGTSSPASKLSVVGADADFRVDSSAATESGRTLMRLRNNGFINFVMENVGNETWLFSAQEGRFTINSNQLSGAINAQFFTSGNLTLAGTLTENSSRTVKHDIAPLDASEVLEKISNLEVSQWRYDSNPDARHVGPMAEDWHALFGLGDNDKGVAPRDLAGVALSAAQALYNRSQQLEAENMELRTRLDRLEASLLSQ